MPFSQQSYTGQGIVQQNVTPRVGEIIGASLANMGQSIGAGIEKFTQRRQEAKELRGELTKLAQFVPKEEKDEFLAQVETGSLGDLKGLQRGIYQQAAMKSMQLEQAAQEERIATSQHARAQNDQLANFLGGYMQARQPQQVTEQVNFGPQIQEAQGNLDKAIQNNRFVVGPESYQYTQSSLPGFTASKPQPDYTGATPRTQALPDQLLPWVTPFARRSETVLPNMSISNALKAAQGLSGETQQPSVQPSPATGPIGPEQMPPEPEEITSMRNRLAELKIQAAEGSTTTRPENQAEYQKRIQDFMVEQIKKNPAVAPLIAKQMFADPKEPKALTAEEQKSMGYAMRMQSAERELGRILKDFKPEGAGQSIAKMLPNLMKSDNRQQYETVAMDWITAVLRRESGAAIGKDEFQRDFKKYFPQPGDSEGTVNLKAKRRQEAVNSITAPMGLGGFGSASIQPRMRYNPSTGKVE